jgi:AcrR family transcriptional regulator
MVQRMNQTPSERGWRGSAELWLDAAYDALVSGGVESVKVAPLAEKLGMSRTSFYWHFADREALLAGLIARWQGRNTTNLIARCDAPAATITQAVLNLFDCWIDPELFDSRLEFSIRTWALTDVALAQVLASSDEARIDAIEAMFGRYGYDAAEADIRAHTIYLTQVGYITVRAVESVQRRIERIPSYALTFTGRVPLADEVAEFRNRHSGAA